MISGAGARTPVCPREDARSQWGNGVVSMLFSTRQVTGPIEKRCRLCRPHLAAVSTMEERCWERDPRPPVEVRRQHRVTRGGQSSSLDATVVAGSVFVDLFRPPPPELEKATAEPYCRWRSSNSLRMWNCHGACASLEV